VNSRYWTLAKRPPPPWPDEATFALKEAPVPTPGPGQALTRTIYVSLDPYQWGYKRRGEEPEGTPCHARSVSQVVESRIDGLAAGDFVFNTNGWAEYGLMGEGVPRPGYMVPRKLDPARGKISHAVGVLGMLGLTAYAGMVLQCEPKQGETTVVSAASGGVGQVAGQIARLKGCRVVGIAGCEEKCRHVVEELNYTGWVRSLLADAAVCRPVGTHIGRCAGTGRDCEFYPQGTNVVGVDFSPAMLVFARRRVRLSAATVELKQMDVTRLNISAGSFDGVVATFLLCILPDDQQVVALQELDRIVKCRCDHPAPGVCPTSWGDPSDYGGDWEPWSGWAYGAGFDRRTEEYIPEAGWELVEARNVVDDLLKLLVAKLQNEVALRGQGERIILPGMLTDKPSIVLATMPK